MPYRFGIIFRFISPILFSAADMFWQMFWPLVLGFTLSALAQVFIPKDEIAKRLGRPGIKEMGLATFFGAASSSCSFAAAAMAKTLFQKGAHIIPAFAFMLASTNLVIELGLIIWRLLGWQFLVAEIGGGILLTSLMALFMRRFGFDKSFVRLKLPEATSLGHCCQTPAPKNIGSLRQVAKAFRTEWKMISRDIYIGVLVSALLMAIIPQSFWLQLFLPTTQHGQFWFWGHLANALIGPLVAVLSFVCSVGNIPIAATLYHQGISFGGTLAFIYADLIVIPLLLVYRKYYGWKMALRIFTVFYLAMALTGLLMGLLFLQLQLVPEVQPMMPPEHLMSSFRIDYTFWLNLAALAVFIFFQRLAIKAP